MTARRWTIAAALALMGASSAASAETICDAAVHSRYGETRAYFGNALGACRPDGYCSVVLALADRSDGAAYAQQLRIARPTAGAAYVVELVAAVPMNAGDGQPMSLGFGRRSIDLGGKAVLPEREANLFRIRDADTVRRIVSLAKSKRSMRWRYRSSGGEADAWFALAGTDDALRWIDCMGAR